METYQNKQKNRFLESPYRIKDTKPSTQTPFNRDNLAYKDLAFSKDGFSDKELLIPKNPDPLIGGEKTSR